MSLYEATKDLHHACEAHPVGQIMTGGVINPHEWADWLWAMRVLHLVVDSAVPAHMARDAAFAADLAALPAGNHSRAALLYAASLAGERCPGAAYVLHGAHRSGGRVLAPKMVKRGLSTAHVCYPDPDGAQEWLAKTRHKPEWGHQARQAFSCMLEVMDEIQERREQ